MIQDEVLAHRLGLIPILADPRKFHSRGPEEVRALRPSPLRNFHGCANSPPCGAGRRAVCVWRRAQDANEENVISFRLKVECSRQKPDTGSGTNDMINDRVTSNMLQWIPQGDQQSRFKDAPIKPVHDDILIAKLRPGQARAPAAPCARCPVCAPRCPTL